MSASEITYDVEVRSPHFGDQPKNPWCRAHIFPGTSQVDAEFIAANYITANYEARIVEIDPKIGWFWCGSGHVYSYGEEDWHHEQARGYAENGRPLPPYCQKGQCMDSAHIVGPYETKQEAKNSFREQQRKNAERNPLESDRDYEVWYFGPIETYRINDRMTKDEALQSASLNTHYKAVKTTREIVTS